MSDDSKHEERTKAVEKALDSNLAAIRAKALEFQQLAGRQRRRYTWARSATVVLGVLAPTIVTFQTQHSGSSQLTFWLGILAITITAGTGIVTGLHASFKWGEGFGRAATASLELEELADSSDLDTLIIRTSTDDLWKHGQLTQHREELLNKQHLIVRKYIEGELALIREADRTQQDKKEVSKN
jgi:hypothetical protein